MKSIEQYLWKLPIALMILVTWIGCGGKAEITTSSSQSRGIMVSSDGMQRTDETAIDKIGKHLVDVAQRVSHESTKQMVDLVFVIDGKLVGKEPEKIQRWLADMTSVFDESTIDHRAAFIWFQGDASQMRGKPLEKGLVIFEEGFGKSPMRFKGVVARHGLDAIMTGLAELEFRLNAEKESRDNDEYFWEGEKHVWDGEKHFVIITSDPLKTDWGAGREVELVEKILERCREDEIQIHIIGMSEEIQVQLAYLSGGKWYEAPERQRKDELVLTDLFMPFMSKVDEIFKHIAQHIAETVQQPIDLVFLFDSSLSMDNKVEDICTGLDALVQVFDGEGLDYRFGVIRFWAAGDSGSSVLTTKPPLNAEQVKQLFRRPRRGNEHLLDAIMRGVPKLETPNNRKLVLIIVTDEPASSGRGTGYTYTGSVEVCRHAGAQVNIIGGVRPLASRSGMFVDADQFQRVIIEATNGTGYIMPGAVPHWRDRFSR